MTTFDDLVCGFGVNDSTRVHPHTVTADPLPTPLPCCARGSATDWLLAQLADGELHKVIRLLDDAREAGVPRERLMQARDVALRGRIVEDIRIDTDDGSMAVAWRLRPPAKSYTRSRRAQR